MSRTTIIRSIAAPVENVFETVAHIESFQKAIPHIVNIEFTSETTAGVGTRFKETRDMNGRRATVEMEVTEYLENNFVRLVSKAGGTVWDTTFTTKPSGNGTQLALEMEAKPYNLLAKLVNPLLMGMIQKAIEKDMDAVKAYCEGQTG